MVAFIPSSNAVVRVSRLRAQSFTSPLAPFMFSTARDVLDRIELSRPSSSVDVDASSAVMRDDESSSPRSRSDANRRRRVASRVERELHAERMRACVDAAPKQTSLVDVYRRQAHKEREGNRCGEGLPKDVIQRVLSRVPRAFFADARLVSTSFRSAVDDETFMPFTKLARALAIGSEEKRRWAMKWFEREAGGSASDCGFGALVKFIAHSKPFKTPLGVEAIVNELEIDRARDVREGDKCARHLTGTALDVAATVACVGKMRLTAGCGWATMAFAMVHVCENEFVGERLICALRRALRASAEKEFVEEDLTEFTHLMSAYFRLAEQPETTFEHIIDEHWLDDAKKSKSRQVHLEFVESDLNKTLTLQIKAERQLMKARLNAAVDYADIEDERELGQPGAIDMPGTISVTTRLTREQEAIVSTHLKAPNWMVVHAFAGSGKTTTLVEYARRNPGLRFLYLAFNKAITLEATKKFPSNTTCKTFHGLAYPLALWYERQGKKLSFGDCLRANEVARALKLSENSVTVGYGLVTFQNFLVSDDDDISEKHCDIRLAYASTANSKAALDVARSLWTMMKDVSNRDIPLTHGGYMKLYSLQRPRLDIDMSNNKNRVGYDVILLDEAQDLSPVMFDIIYRQNNCAKVLVGDSHQQIYNFTGATNVLDGISKRVQPELITHRRLARSFRFGKDIAHVANSILRVKGKNESALVIGARPSAAFGDHVYGGERFQGNIENICIHDTKGKKEQLCILVRTTTSLIQALVQLVTSIKGVKICVIGGVDSLKLEQVLDFVRLMSGDVQGITDKYVRRFIAGGAGNASLASDSRPSNGLARIIQIAQNQNDHDTLLRIAIAQQYGDTMFDYAMQINKADVGTQNEQSANYVLSTAHKSKGLEWDSVFIWNDFIEIDYIRKSSYTSDVLVHLERGPIDVDEINLVYVAVTRARKRIFLNYSLSYFLKKLELPAVVRFSSGLLNYAQAWATDPLDTDVCYYCDERMGAGSRLVWEDAAENSKRGLICVTNREVHLIEDLKTAEVSSSHPSYPIELIRCFPFFAAQLCARCAHNEALTFEEYEAHDMSMYSAIYWTHSIKHTLAAERALTT